MDYISEIDRLDRRIHRYLLKNTFKSAREDGAHPGQIPILMCLAEADMLTQSELAERLGITPATVAVSLKRMELAGLVVRKRDRNDFRALRVSLSEAGARCAEEARRRKREYDSVKFSALNEKEIEQLYGLFIKMERGLAESYGEVRD